MTALGTLNLFRRACWNAKSFQICQQRLRFRFFGRMIDVFCGTENSIKVTVVFKEYVCMAIFLFREDCKHPCTSADISSLREMIKRFKSAGKNVLRAHRRSSMDTQK